MIDPNLYNGYAKDIVLWLNGEEELDGSDSSKHKDIAAGMVSLCKKAGPVTLLEVADKLHQKRSSFLAYMIVRFNDLDDLHRRRIVKLLAKRSTRIHTPGKYDLKITIKYSDLKDLTNEEVINFINLYSSNINDIIGKWDLTREEIDKICFNYINMSGSAAKIRMLLTRSAFRNPKNTEEVMARAMVENEVKLIENGKLNLYNVLYEGYSAIKHKSFHKLEDYCYEHGLLGYGE